MTKVSEFLDNLRPSLRRCLNTDDVRGHRSEFLAEVEEFWEHSGPEVLASLDSERRRLVSLGQAVGQRIIACWPQVGESFVRKGTERLAAFDRDRSSILSVGSPFRRDVDRWLEDRRAHVQSLVGDPLREPAWLRLGCQDSSPRGIRWTSRRGLWTCSAAPWVRRAAEHFQLLWPTDISVEPTGLSGIALTLSDSWWSALDGDLPLKLIADYQREQANGPWFAAATLDRLFGADWLALEHADALCRRQRCVVKWFLTMEESFRIWLTDTWPSDAVKARVGRIGEGDAETFAGFRRAGEHLDAHDAEPYALMTMYCLEAIARFPERRGSAGGSSKPVRVAGSRRRPPRTEPTEKEMEAWAVYKRTGSFKAAGEALSKSPQAVRKLVTSFNEVQKRRSEGSRSVRAVRRLPEDRDGQVHLGDAEGVNDSAEG